MAKSICPRHCKTLIVEDNHPFWQQLKEMLTLQFPSMMVFEAADSNTALKRVEADRSDLIFMDVKLPGKNGLELTKKIKACCPHVVVLILTMYDLPEYRDVARQYGADYFLSKDSTTQEEIVALVKSILTG